MFPRLITILFFGMLSGLFASNAIAQSENIGTSQQEIRGGTIVTGFQGVVEFSVPRPDQVPPGATGCTGNMIARNVILTAAHCFDRLDGMGAQNRTTGNTMVTVNYHDPVRGRRQVFNANATWIVDPSYRGITTSGPGDANADMGMIVIPGEFLATTDNDYLRIYSDVGNALETWLDAYGAGRFLYSSPNGNDNRLRHARMEVENVELNHIVVDNRTLVTLCAGDSGGPLIYKVASSQGTIATIAGVLSQSEVDPGDEGILCANNDPPFDDSFYSRTNWRKFRGLAARAGLSCSSFTEGSRKYRRCFGVPFVNDAPMEGLAKGRAVAAVIAAVF